MKISRKMAGLTLFVTMALAGAACDAATTDGGTAPGQEIPADDGLGTGDGMGGGGTGDTGGMGG